MAHPYVLGARTFWGRVWQWKIDFGGGQLGHAPLGFVDQGDQLLKHRMSLLRYKLVLQQVFGGRARTHVLQRNEREMVKPCDIAAEQRAEDATRGCCNGWQGNSHHGIPKGCSDA